MCTTRASVQLPAQSRFQPVTHHELLRMFCSKRVSLRSERWNWMMGSWSKFHGSMLLAASRLLGCLYVSMSHILVWFNMIHSIMVGSQAHQNVLRELMLVLLQDCFEFLQRPSLTLPTLLVCFTFSCHYLRTHLYYIYIILLYVYMCMICMCIIYIYAITYSLSHSSANTQSMGSSISYSWLIRELFVVWDQTTVHHIPISACLVRTGDCCHGVDLWSHILQPCRVSNMKKR